MMSVKPVTYVCVLLTLLACSAGKIKDEDSAFYSVPVGSAIVLNREITISGDEVAIYVQHGELMSYDEVNKYNPNCKFELFAMSTRPRTVKPDTFEITKVVDDIESSSAPASIRLAVAENGYNLASLFRSHVYNYATLMYLKSIKQKDVYRMTCQHWEDIRDDRYLSVSQMRAAMGDVFTLVIKQD